MNNPEDQKQDYVQTLRDIWEKDHIKLIEVIIITEGSDDNWIIYSN